MEAILSSQTIQKYVTNQIWHIGYSLPASALEGAVFTTWNHHLEFPHSRGKLALGPSIPILVAP